MSSPSTADASADAYLPSYSPLAWQLDAYLIRAVCNCELARTTILYCTTTYRVAPRALPMALLLCFCGTFTYCFNSSFVYMCVL